MYIPTMALQTRIFLLSIGLGFLLGILYDVFYIIRLMITKNKYAIYIQDILYLLVCSFITFLYILALNYGVVRGYVLLGELFGWVIYYLSSGFFVINYATKAIYKLKKTIKNLFLLIIKPFKMILTKIYKQILRIYLCFYKKIRKINRKFKISLKSNSKLVYNKMDIVGENVVTHEGNDNKWVKRNAVVALFLPYPL